MEFHDRFNITVDARTARRNLANRLYDLIFTGLLEDLDEMREGPSLSISKSIAFALGARFEYRSSVSRYIGVDFYKHLHAVEVFFWAAKSFQNGVEIQNKINDYVLRALSYCEVDLSIGWKNGKFFRKGAEELDKSLINEPLQWLGKQEFQIVKEPFEKALRHFLESDRRPELLADAITDAYEALETMVKISTKKDRDLTANAEYFLKLLTISVNYKPVLKEYIKYANYFRHGAINKKVIPSSVEVESFLYLTGLFLRLAVQIHGKEKLNSKTA